MRKLRGWLCAVFLTAAFVETSCAHAPRDTATPPPAENPSGRNAFDVRTGQWVAHHRRLKERLAGSTEWIEFDGTQTLWPLMDGGANVDENLFRMPGNEFRGVSLRSYDPKTGKWAIWWLDGRNPFADLNPPVRGRFENGVGTFYSDETLRGQPIRVRFVWSDLTPTTAHWEQAFSPDGGKTWETNWVTDFRKVSASASASPSAAPAQATLTAEQGADLSGLHAFDALAGRWTARHRRLKERLAGNNDWAEFGGTFDFRLLMGSAANVDDSVFDMPDGRVHGVGMSAYDAKTGQWAIWGLDGRNPGANIDPPLKGRFENGVGTFYADDTLRGQPIRVRVTWSHLSPTTAHWEQAFSPDGGKTWETNWVTDFRRAP